LGVTSAVSEGCLKGFLDTNKKNKLQNPSGNYETNLMILIVGVLDRGVLNQLVNLNCVP